jgi:hypothetical protein
LLPAPRTEKKAKRIELKDRSASPKTDAEPVAGGANFRRRSRFFNALSVKLRGSHAPLRRTTRFTALPGKSDYNCVTKCWQNSPRQLCGSALGKPARVAISDSKFGICKSLAGQRFMLHNFNPLNEILYCFSRKSVPWPNLDTLAYKRFGTNAGADTQAPSERAARKI